MDALVITADDFGADPAVNEAVERAHRKGVLSATSLMVGAPAAADAVARARAMPRLGVGLHLVLVDGRPVLPPERVPALVGADGRFRDGMAAAGVRFLGAAARAQLASEVAAQFAAFDATGLRLDHVNAHKHFHLHPVVADLLIGETRARGARWVRAPIEPARTLDAVEPGRASLEARAAGVWARALARKLARAGLRSPDAVFGLRWSGRFTRARWLGLLARLPAGTIEAYAHPATRDDPAGHAAGAWHVDELRALTDAAVIEAVRASGRRLVPFAGV